MGQFAVKPFDAPRAALRIAALASAFGFAAVPAEAADLPSGGAAAAPQGLATCSVAGMVGFVSPGTDICVKLSGYVAAQTFTGSLSPQFGLFFTGTPGSSKVSSATLTPIDLRDSLGFTTRGELAIDARSNSSYGLVRGYAELLATNSSGFDSAFTVLLVNQAFLQFGGLTAGRVGSFFSYLAGGETWYDFYSPDRVFGNQPDVIAYTATLGSGLTATLSFEDPTGAVVNNGIDGGFDNAYSGLRYPDIVASLRLDQSWGSAQVSAVAHNTHIAEGVSGDNVDHWGGAALIGAIYNLPMIAAGDKIGAQFVASTAALGYSGIPNTAESPFDQGLNLNGNGTIFQLTDALNFTSGAWSYPTTWSAAAYFEHHFSSQFIISPEISWAYVQYSNSPAMISTHASSVLGGAIAHWIPVPHLDFQLHGMIENTVQATPAAYTAPPAFVGHSWGVAGAFEIVRDF